MGTQSLRHIGMLTTSYPRFSGDFGGSFVEGMAKGLLQRGHRVTVLAPPRRGIVKSPSAQQPERLTVRRVPSLWPRGWESLFDGTGVPDALERAPHLALEAAFYLAAVAPWARRVTHEVDTWISHWLLPCGVTVAGVASHRRHLAVAHSSDVRLLARLPLRGLLVRLLLKGDTQVMFSSHAVRELLFSRLSEEGARRLHQRSFVQPMGVDLEGLRGGERRATREDLAVDAGAFCVLWLGRVVSVKRPLWLVELARKVPQAVFVVAGEGPSLPTLKEEVAKAGLGLRFRFLGAVGPARRRHLLAACDAMVLTSQAPSREESLTRSEGAPVVLMEAAAAGVPAVATDVGGVGELVNHGRTGFVCSPRDPSPMARVLRQLERDEALRGEMARRARHHGEGYGWDRVLDRMEPYL